ncbi:hypothetical protein ACFP1I_12185 [Dyadobacter subterraneus]|uniref:Cadherin-like beta sandwich domain-containing protein n=1 Tax=Dyadobacter subterraneus TaxID=2773304 RepID=A0ABR9WM61_9BACT|nr:hypothetical protein [Dyadobacter subterraneus]MBE9466605.1 hypothetical protein [Dyadobacter subterraneus]
MFASICCTSLTLQISYQKAAEGLNDMPSIRAVSLIGVPQKDVTFDSRTSTITLKLSAILENGLKPELELSDGAEVVSGLLPDNTIDLASYRLCNPTAEKQIFLRISDGSENSTYILQIVQTGKLKVISEIRDLTFSRKTKRLEMSLQVEILYTNPSITTLIFTNLATGASALINADAACLNSCKSTALNQLIFPLGSPIEHDLTPGTYSIAFNGLEFPQKLITTE